MRVSASAAALIAVSLALVVPYAACAQTFEGVITANYYMQGKTPMEVKNLIKGTHSRSEMGMQRQKMYMLTDLEKQEVTTVMPDQKMYMTMNWKDAEAQAQKSKPEGGEGKMPAFEKTGKTETIAGHSCEHYLVGEEKDVDVCAARGMGVMGMGNFKGGMAGRMFGAQAKAHGNEEYLALAEEGFYPLKMETIEGGNRKLIMEVTKIEPQSLSDDLFTIPAGYSEMKMPKMPGM